MMWRVTKKCVERYCDLANKSTQQFYKVCTPCIKKTSVSHSSTESEIISLDAGLRLDGLLALELWDLIVSVFGSNLIMMLRNIQNRRELGDLLKNKREVCCPPLNDSQTQAISESD